MTREVHWAPDIMGALRLAAVVGLTVAIFVADTLTDLEIAVAVFYVAVVLISVGFLQPRGVVVVSVLCMVLTLVSYYLSHSGSHESGLINCLISITAIGATAYLALQTTSAILAVHEARAQLARVSRVIALGELTASIAHEVNQPLTAIVASGNACRRWLAAQPPNLVKAEQAAERIIKDANRASEVVTRVHSLAKSAPTCKQWLSVADTVSEILALTRNEMHKNHVVLRTEIGEDLPPVLADGIQLQQVLLNTIMNAIEAMQTTPPGERRLYIAATANDKNAVTFTVRDSGHGLQADNIDRMFDAFYSTKPNGIGIGLTISRSIVEAHGGRIWAETSADGGASVRFTLPAGEVA